MELIPSASYLTSSSVSPRALDCPIACSKKKCEVRWVRFSHRSVPLRASNGVDWPAVGVVEYASTTSVHAPAGATQVIRLDPGLAFGTGTHPTTRMCLRWTAAQPTGRSSQWQRVLDYGCGSGILAIGVALHGARDVDAVDIDAAAIEATTANAAANGVTLKAGLPQKAHGEYALVFANILATPLKLLAPLLCAHVASGGDLVLAGILERQADELKTAYATWLALEVSDAEDGWILMTARRSA